MSMRKISYIMMIVAVLGLMMVGCEDAAPQVDKPVPEEPENPNEPETPEDPNEGDEPNEPEEPIVDAPFEIQVIEKTELSFMYNVYPADKTMEYIYLTDTAKNLAANGVTSDEGIPAFDLELFKREAETYGTSVEEHVRNYYITTDEVRMVEVNGIPPGEEFVIYAYGVEFIDGMPVPTTEVITVHDTTLEAEITEMPMDIIVEVNRCTAAVTTKPEGFKGNYFTFIEKSDIYFPDTTPTEEQLVEVAMDIYYRSLALYLQFGFPLEAAIQELTVRGTYTADYADLLSDTDYFAAAVPIDNATGLIYAYPTVTTFKTDVVGQSDNIIDISVSNIKSREATVKVTPSNDDPYIVACFESAAFEGKTGDEIIDYYVANFPMQSLGGGFEYTFTGLTPNTELFIAAFGYEGGVVTTKLFRADFKTESESIADIDIECEIIGAFDLAEVAALNSDYQYLLDYGYQALFAYEFTTTPQAAGIQYGLYVRASTEGLDDDTLRQAIIDNREIKTSFTPVNFIDYWGKEYVILAVARDEAGNPSALYKSEPYTATYEGRGRAEDFLMWRHPGAY